MRSKTLTVLLSLFIGVACHAQPSTTVKIASLDMLSGPMAGLGSNILKSFQYVAKKANDESWAGQVKFEIVPFDNKYSAQEALTLFQQIVGRDIHYIVQGASTSSVGMALIDAINKHNERNPGHEVVYLNYAAQAPAMTNEKCSFWHFRLDANSDMKVEAMTSFLARDPKVKRVYMINPSHVYGQEVSRAVRETLAKKRPDIQITGDDFHPAGQVKDFAPYIGKIKQSGADIVISADAGLDLALIAKAMKEFGLGVDLYTLNGNTYGVPAAIGAAGEGRVRLVSAFNPNDPTLRDNTLLEDFKKRYDEDFINALGYDAIVALAKAIRESKSVDPVQVAHKLEGLKFAGLNGEMELRKADHQAQLPLYVMSWEKVDGKVAVHDQEKTGLGWKPIATVSVADSARTTRCEMKRPAVNESRR